MLFLNIRPMIISWHKMANLTLYYYLPNRDEIQKSNVLTLNTLYGITELNILPPTYHSNILQWSSDHIGFKIILFTSHDLQKNTTVNCTIIVLPLVIYKNSYWTGICFQTKVWMTLKHPAISYKKFKDS